MKTGSTDISFWQRVAQDLGASIMTRPPKITPWILKHIFFGMLFWPNFSCVFWYRVNRYLYLHKLPGQRFLNARRMLRFGNDISYVADIGPGFAIKHLSGIVIGGDAKLGTGVVIFNGVTIGAKSGNIKGMPCIGDNVRIYAGAKVLGPVRIGNNSLIGTLSLCMKDVPDNSIMYGIPPSVTIKPRESSEIV